MNGIGLEHYPEESIKLNVNDAVVNVRLKDKEGK